MEHRKPPLCRIEENLRRNTHTYTRTHYTYINTYAHAKMKKTCFKQQAAYLNRVSNGNSINAVLRAMNTIDLNFVCVYAFIVPKKNAKFIHTQARAHTHIAEYHYFSLWNMCMCVCVMCVCVHMWLFDFYFWQALRFKTKRSVTPNSLSESINSSHFFSTFIITYVCIRIRTNSSCYANGVVTFSLTLYFCCCCCV